MRGADQVSVVGVALTLILCLAPYVVAGFVVRRERPALFVSWLLATFSGLVGGAVVVLYLCSRH